jgi:ribose-phosphate pyrophosphokinase
MVIFMIIGGSSSQKLAANIAHEMNDVFCPLETRKFPDGERYIRIKKEVDDGVVVVQSTGFPQDENLMELFLILKTLRSMGVKDIRTVIPYFGYGRQEKRFNSGEAISAEVVCQLIEFAGASSVYSLNLHEKSICDFFQIPAFNLSAMPAIAQYVGKNVEDPVIIAPDKGALGFAQEVAEILGCQADYLEKIRLSPEKVETKPKNLDVEGRDAVIIDDIISTGGTIVNACQILKEHNVGQILVSCVHPVLVGDALLKIFAAGADDVVGTNTLKSEVSTVSVASLVAEALEKD